ncbi:Hypothetical protein POVR1_LOCUS404 [uncultured virus]|nr:Hypothetical protein POVR1_LOCUS404 [uncultured virus]
MSSVVGIEGLLASPAVIELIETLYSDCSLQSKVIINVSGDKSLVQGFLDFVSSYDGKCIGYEEIAFSYTEETQLCLVTNHGYIGDKSANFYHMIVSSDYEDELERILLHYI